jgi:hypothetical protein
MTYYVMSGDTASRFVQAALAVLAGLLWMSPWKVAANHTATGLRPQGSILLLINSFPKFHYLRTHLRRTLSIEAYRVR